LRGVHTQTIIVTDTLCLYGYNSYTA